MQIIPSDNAGYDGFVNMVGCLTDLALRFETPGTPAVEMLLDKVEWSRETVQGTAYGRVWQDADNDFTMKATFVLTDDTTVTYL